MRRSADEFIRLYDEHGAHYASLLPCGCDYEHTINCGKNHYDCINDSCEPECCSIITNYDLAKPDGKVIYCGITSELFECFVKSGSKVFNFETESIEDEDDN